MSFISLTIAFWMAFITFYVNQSVHRLRSIKILINTLFYIYGNPNIFDELEPKDIPGKLMDEIIGLEKMHDDNFIISNEIDKLKKLRLAYFTYLEHLDKNKTINEISQIKFVKLGNTFIILSFLNLRLPFHK